MSGLPRQRCHTLPPIRMLPLGCWLVQGSALYTASVHDHTAVVEALLEAVLEQTCAAMWLMSLQGGPEPLEARVRCDRHEPERDADVPRARGGAAAVCDASHLRLTVPRTLTPHPYPYSTHSTASSCAASPFSLSLLPLPAGDEKLSLHPPASDILPRLTAPHLLGEHL